MTRGSIGPLNGLNLLIDTGTIPSVVDRSVARKLRLETRDAIASTSIAASSAVAADGEIHARTTPGETPPQAARRPRYVATRAE